MRPDAGLPAILVEDFAEERVRRARVAARPGPSMIAMHPPGYELVARLAAVIAIVKQDYARTIGTHRDFSPRLHSRVEHRIEALLPHVGEGSCRRRVRMCASASAQ